MIKVNLLSPEKKEIAGAGEEIAFIEEVKEHKINVMAAVGAVVLTIGIIGFLYFVQTSTIESKRKHLDERRARKVELDNVLKKLDELEKTKNELDQKVKLIQELKSQQQITVKMMDQLSHALPEWTWVTSLSFSGRKLSFSGKALSNEIIADFMNSLKATNYFYNIELGSTTRKSGSGQDLFVFKITCFYQEPTVKRKAV